MNTLLIQCISDPCFELCSVDPALPGVEAGSLVSVDSFDKGLAHMLRKMPQLVVFHTDSLGPDLRDFFYLAQSKGTRSIVVCGSEEVLFGIMNHADPQLSIKPVIPEEKLNTLSMNMAPTYSRSVGLGSPFSPRFEAMDVFRFSQLAIQKNTGVRFISVNNIVRVEYLGSDSRLYLDNGEVHLSRRSLDELSFLLG